MSGKFFERWAARKNPRFQVFVEGKDAYESFIQEARVRFDEMSEEHYSRARNDPRIKVAERCFTTAIDMSEKEGALADAAVAKYQLGLVRHARGELHQAEALFKPALKVMSSMPQRNRAPDMSACHYHLGIIAQKQGWLAEAVQELLRSRQMDEATGDFSGMQLCNLALAGCAKQGADIEADTAPPPTDAGSWESPEDAAGVSVEEESESEADFKPTDSVRFDQRELIWLASYSVQANDLLMAHLNSLANEFGRPVGVSRVAFGSIDPAQRNLSPPESDQHLCATILVLERKGLNDQDFQELAAACIRRVMAVPDFRLLVYLHDLTLDDLRELADQEPFIAALFETTQIAASPSLEQLRRTLVPFVRSVERIRAAAHWRVVRLKLASWCGNLANVVLLAAALLALLGIPAWLLKINLDWLGPHGSKLASLVLGMLAFPLQSPMIFLLLRGMRATAMAPRDNASLMRWVVVGAVIMLAANHLQHALQGPYSWIYPGLAIGILFDAIRRAGKRASREMLDFEVMMGHVVNPALKDPKLTVLRGDPLNPFSCPLLPALSARVFISYTRSSAKASKLAAALHRGLKEAGALPFLDRASIPAGASWRRSLNEHLGACDVFVCILDQKGAQREWVAAELLAALEGRQLTGAPEIVILVDSEIQHGSQTMLPVFRGVASAAGESPVQGRPQIVQINEQTQSSLVWGLAPGRFAPASVFTRIATLPIMYAMMLLSAIGGMGIVTGYVLGFLVMLEKFGKFPFLAWLTEHGCLEPLELLTAFWLGFTARATIAWGIERNHGREMGMTTPAIATIGLIWATFDLIPRSSILVAVWSGVLVITGWVMVASAMHMGVKEQKNRRN